MSETCSPEAGYHARVIRCLTHGTTWTVDEWPDRTLPCPSALAAAVSAELATGSVPPADEPTTSMTRLADLLGEPVIDPTLPPDVVEIRNEDGSTSVRIVNVSASTSPPSEPSETPSTPSTRRWRTPRSAMEFAGQANRVATMILNGEIDVETGRLYSSVARTVAQSLSTEVQRSRFLQHEPDLTFPNTEEDDG